MDHQERLVSADCPAVRTGAGRMRGGETDNIPAEDSRRRARETRARASRAELPAFRPPFGAAERSAHEAGMAHDIDDWLRDHWGLGWLGGSRGRFLGEEE